MVAGWTDAVNVILIVNGERYGRLRASEKGRKNIETRYITRHEAHPDLTYLCSWQYDEID
jgi:hypothetical protein